MIVKLTFWWRTEICSLFVWIEETKNAFVLAAMNKWKICFLCSKAPLTKNDFEIQQYTRHYLLSESHSKAAKLNIWHLCRRGDGSGEVHSYGHLVQHQVRGWANTAQPAWSPAQVQHLRAPGKQRASQTHHGQHCGLWRPDQQRGQVRDETLCKALCLFSLGCLPLQPGQHELVTDNLSHEHLGFIQLSLVIAWKLIPVFIEY